MAGKIRATLPSVFKLLLETAGAEAVGREANTRSYYIDVTALDGRTIVIRDADHGGYNSWNGRGSIPTPAGQINLTCGRRLRHQLAAHELAKWLGLDLPRSLDMNSMRAVRAALGKTSVVSNV